MAAWSLPTCTRCQKRKKKCDKILPSCKNCTADGFECVFYDQHTESIVSRRAIRDLEEKAKRLEIELESLQAIQPSNSTLQLPVSRGSLQDSGILMPSDHLSNSDRDHWQGASFSQQLFIGSIGSRSGSDFIGHGSAVDLGPTAATSAGIDAFEHSVPGGPVLQLPNSNSTLLRAEKLDRSVIEPSLVRELIDGCYFPILHQLYPVVERSQLEFNVQIKQLPLRKRLFVVLTAAIAAAYQSRRDQSMQTIALILRCWADDLISEVISGQDDDSLQALILLIFYELIDPRRKIIWHLLGFACRMCIKFRWHREEESEQLVLLTAAQDLAYHRPRYPSNWRKRLFCIVYEWERLICLTLQRPSIFSCDLVDMGCASERKLQTLHLELTLREKSQDCSEHKCILNCRFISFVDENLSSSEGSDILWLTLYLIMQYSWVQAAIHEQYKYAWTEQILRAAMSRINTLFTAQRCGQIVSIWLSTIDVFTAGTIMLDLILRQSSATSGVDLDQEWPRVARKASSLLAGFAELWEGARVYRDVFDATSDRASIRGMIHS